MWIRVAAACMGLICLSSTVRAQDFRIQDLGPAQSLNTEQLKPGIIAFNDGEGSGVDGAANLISFADWARTQPAQKKFLSLFPDYTEPNVIKEAAVAATADAVLVTERLTMYVAQARFMLDRAPSSLDLSRYATVAFLQKVDPSIKHTAITAGDLKPFNDRQGTGNENPQRKWCTGRDTLVCVQSSYKLEGKIPIGVALVNKLRDSAKKISDQIDFDSELSLVSPADMDAAGLKELTGLDTPIAGVLTQNIFYVNQIMKFGKFFAVFQGDPTNPKKTLVTAYMALAIESSVLDKKKEFENVPVLRNLVPGQVLMGQSTFNSGNSISAGLPKYARNEIRTIAGLLAADTISK